MKIYGYARVSTKHQRESLDQQIDCSKKNSILNIINIPKSNK